MANEERNEEQTIKFILKLLKDGQLCSWNLVKKEVYLFSKGNNIVDTDSLQHERYILGVWNVTQPHKDGCNIFPLFIRALRNRIEWYGYKPAFFVYRIKGLLILLCILDYKTILFIIIQYIMI